MQADGGSSGLSADAFQSTMQLVNVLAHSRLFSCLDFLTYLPAFPSSHLHCLSQERDRLDDEDDEADNEDETTLLKMQEKKDEHLMWIAEMVRKSVIKEST
jgi:hypothetical protein